MNDINVFRIELLILHESTHRPLCLRAWGLLACCLLFIISNSIYNIQVLGAEIVNIQMLSSTYASKLDKSLNEG